MRLLFIFMQNPWQGLVWWVGGVFNGGTVCRRRLLQQGKFEGYGSHAIILVLELKFSLYLEGSRLLDSILSRAKAWDKFDLKRPEPSQYRAFCPKTLGTK